MRSDDELGIIEGGAGWSLIENIFEVSALKLSVEFVERNCAAPPQSQIERKTW